MTDKTVRFYLAALSEAGQPISPHFKVRKAKVSGSVRRKSTKRFTGRLLAAEEEEEDEFFDTPGMERFQIPIPGKQPATVIVPKDLSPEDWEMLTTMLDAYIARFQKQLMPKKETP